MNDHLSLSPAGANLVKAFENCLAPAGKGKFKAYLCPAGVLTIGWGHTNHHGRRFDASSIWTQRECDDAFDDDMAGFEAAVRKLVKVDLDQHQFDALVSFAYNCGEGNLRKSTLLRKLNRGDFDGAAREFPKWNKGGGKVLRGLVRRRASEALLFQGIPDRDYDGKADIRKPRRAAVDMADAMPQAVDPPQPPKTMAKSVEGYAHLTTTGTGTSIAGSEVTASVSTIDKVIEAKDKAAELGIDADPVTLWELLGPVLTKLASSPLFWIGIGIAIIGIVGFYRRRRRLYGDMA
jgi:lysozyme